MRIFNQLPEPTADQRQLALIAAGVFAAYIDAGFTREEAIDLLKTSIAANSQGSNQ